MKTTEALSLLTKLWELETIAQVAETPEGRWQLLQDWLRDNPAWEKQINKWVQLSPKAAFVSLKSYVAEQAEIPAIMLDKFITESVGQRVIAAIQTIQTCYRERKQVDSNQQTRKEIAK